jgi:hypothetical protein
VVDRRPVNSAVVRLCFLMKLIFSALLIAFAGSAFAQINYPLASVREDFHEASVVVRMNITDTKLTGNDDGYAFGFIASGRVTQSFKGKFKPGQRLDFYVRAEHGYDPTHMRGDQIAFLTSFVNRKNGPFQTLPDGNSVNAYSAELLDKVRTVWREWRVKRKHSLSTTTHNKSLDRSHGKRVSHQA